MFMVKSQITTLKSFKFTQTRKILLAAEGEEEMQYMLPQSAGKFLHMTLASLPTKKP